MTDKQKMRLTLERVSHEAHEIARGLAQVDDMIGDIAGQLGVPAANSAAFQDVDRLRQRAEDLAAFLHHLAAAVPDVGEVPTAQAFAALRLGEMRARLGGAPDTSREDRQVDLF